jgi:hypothetical protein
VKVQPQWVLTSGKQNKHGFVPLLLEIAYVNKVLRIAVRVQRVHTHTASF